MSLFRERLLSRIEAAGVDSGRIPLVPELSGDQFSQLERYFDLLRHWNRRINLTSLPLEGLADQTIDRLFVEPLCAARFLDERLLATGTDRVNGKTGVGRTLSGPASPVLRWADLGSGGGSPAIPLKIACPSAQLTMVESRGRKAAFLQEVVRELGMKETAVASVRAEALPETESYAAITVRAVRLDREFVAAVCRLLTREGRLILFLPAPSEIHLDSFTLIHQLNVASAASQIALLSKVDR